MSKIESLAQLRDLYKKPGERALKKQLEQLDKHCKNFIELSRFAVLSTSDGAGNMDASPRGGEPGFIKVRDDKTLLIADWPGNNRLDTLSNIIVNNHIGLLIFIPGVDEVLRINGHAELRTEQAMLVLCSERERLPKLVITVAIKEAFLHCAKAIMRSQLWSLDAQIERSELPTMGQMLKDQLASSEQPESQQEMVERYKEVLY